MATLAPGEGVGDFDERMRRVAAVRALADTLRSRHPDDGFLMHPALEIAASGPDGVHYRTTAAVAQGDILLVVPETERLSVRSFLATAGTGHGTADTTVDFKGLFRSIDAGFRAFVAATDGDHTQSVLTMDADFADGVAGWIDDLQLTLAIMNVLSEPSRSPFGPYVASWPTFHSPSMQQTVGYWTKCGHDLLAGTYAGALFQGKSEGYRRVYDRVVRPLLEGLGEQGITSFQSAANPMIPGEPETMWEDFRHAWSIRNSRCHEGRAAGAADLVPLVDLIDGMPGNHPDLNVEINAGRWPWVRGAMYTGSTGKPCSAVAATRPLKAGERLLISYGDTSPCIFALKYGAFPKQMLTPGANDIDEVRLTVPPVGFLPPRSDTLRWRSLEASGFTKERIATEVGFYLTSQDYHTFVRGIRPGGGGGMPPPGCEADELKGLRQFVLLCRCADTACLRTNIESGRLRSNTFDVGTLVGGMVAFVDYQLGLIAGASSDDELLLAASESDLLGGNGHLERPWMATARMARVSQRESLLMWRRAITTMYGFGDEARILVSYPSNQWIDPPRVAWDAPAEEGCAVCGRSLGLKACSRCRAVQYCCTAHQKKHWKQHKTVCQQQRPAKAVAANAPSPTMSAASVKAATDVRVADMSVSQLKAAITAAGMSFADCLEKADLRSRATEAIISFNYL